MSDRLMGLDFGAFTVGVAISDELNILAHEHSTIKRPHEKKLRRTFAEIERLVALYDIGRIIVGLPVYEDGTESGRSLKARDFAEQVGRRTAIPVTLYDERFTTASAREILDISGIPRDMQKEHIDKIAAAIILQDYMDNVLSRE